MNATTYNNPIAQTGTNANNATVYASGSPSNPNLVGVRDTLKNQFGIDNNRIGYNGNNGYVQVDGQDVFKPAQNIDGTTYDTQDTFNSVGGKLNALNQQYKLQQQAMNPQGLNPYQNQVGDLLNQLKTMQTQGTPTMQDVYNSPQYAAAQAQQQLAAQQGINAAQEALGASGMARSSDLANDAQNVQNRANLYLQTQAAPAILAALQNQRQQQYSNVANLLNSLSSMNSQANQTELGQQNAAINLLNQLNQQKYNEANLTGQFNGQQTLAGKNQVLNEEQAQANLTGMLPNGSPTYAAQQQAIQNAIARANAFGQVTSQQDADLLGVPIGTDTRALQAMLNDMAYKNAEIGIRQQANDIASQREGNQAAHYGAMDNYYNARANNNGGNATQAKNNLESTYVSNLEQMTPDNRAAFFKNEKANIVKDLGQSGYNQLYNSYFDQYGDPK